MIEDSSMVMLLYSVFFNWIVVEVLCERLGTVELPCAGSSYALILFKEKWAGPTGSGERKSRDEYLG